MARTRRCPERARWHPVARDGRTMRTTDCPRPRGRRAPHRTGPIHPPNLEECPLFAANLSGLADTTVCRHPRVIVFRRLASAAPTRPHGPSGTSGVSFPIFKGIRLLDPVAFRRVDQKSRSCFGRSLQKCRVAPGGCPPGAPTDPYVRISRIRFLGSRVRCARQS